MPREEFAAPLRDERLRFDVFLSHNSLDKPLVERIAERLKREGLEPWLDAWHLVPGAAWQRGLAQGLAASSSCAVFVGPTDLGAWENQEVGVALDRAATDPEFRLFLVLLPGLPERFDAAELLPFLRMRTWVDYRRGLDDGRAFQALVGAIKGLPLGPRFPIERDTDVCPYRGLEAFEEEHAPFFFGREADVQRLLEKLKGTRFVAVLGASGSGKSSLVRAGLAPALKRGAMSGEAPWEVAFLRPGPHPLEALAAQLIRLGANVPMQTTLDGLSADARTLHLASSLALAERPGGTRLLLVVDQFEEVFTLCRDDVERRAFFANLLYAGTIPNGRTGVLLAMRADFYSRCGPYPELAQQLAAEQYLVSPLQPDGLRQAVEEPARRAGLAFEPGLVGTILEDVEHQPGALPLLEHSLLELWRRRTAGLLTLAGYRESGGVQGAIAQRAEQVFQSLAPDQQQLARRTFLRLTQPGEGTEDTRRRAQLAELEGSEGGEELGSVLGELVNARLVTTSADDTLGGEVVEVAHEALIRGWPRLRSWIDDDRAGLLVHRRLTEAAQEWEQLGGDEGALYRGARLAETLGWRNRDETSLNDLERAFLDASAELRERERRETEERSRRELEDARRVAEAQRRSARIFRRAAVVLAVLAVAAAAATVFAVSSRNSARHEQELGRSRALAATSLSLIPVDSELSRLLAIEALGAGRTTEALAAARRAIRESRLRFILPVSRPLAARFTGDGRRIFTVDQAGAVRRWNAESGKALGVRRLKLQPGERLDTASLSPDGRFALVGTVRPGKRGSFRLVASLLELASGDLKARAIGRPGEVAFRHMSFSGDGTRALVSGDYLAIVWQLPSGRRVGVLDHGGSTQDAALAPDGKLAFIGGVDAVEIWDVEKQRRVVRLAPYFRNLEHLALSADGTLVAASGLRPSKDEGAASAAHVWDVRSHRRLASLNYNGATVSGREVFSQPIFTPERGSPLIALASGVGVRMWNGRTDQVTTVLSGHQAVVETIAFSPDGRLLATGSLDNTARVWSLATGQTVDLLNGFSGTVSDVAFNPRGDRLLTLGGDSTVRSWRVGKTRDVERRWVPKRGRLLTCGPFRRRGDIVPSACADDAGRVWDVTDASLLATPDGLPVLLRQRKLSLVGFSADGRTLLATSFLRPKTFRLVVADGDSGKILRELRLPSLQSEETDYASLSPDGRHLVTGSRSGALVWDARGEGPATKLGSGSAIQSATFSGDARYVLGDDEKTPKIWRTGDWGLVGSLARCGKQRTPAPPSVFNRDDTAVASICGTTVRISSVQGRTLRTMTDVDASEVEALAFSPDGSLLLAVTGGGLLRAWEVDSGRKLRDMRVLALGGYVGLKSLWLNDRGRIAYASPEVAELYPGSGFEAVRLYECEECGGVEEVLAEACRDLTRGFTVDERVVYLHEPRAKAVAAGSMPEACSARTRSGESSRGARA